MKRVHRLLLASAGTGKTFQLTNRYLRLLLEGVDPGRVLATTFTRKAAGEILDRVLERLVEASGSDEARSQLAVEIDRPVEAAECRRLVGQLARGIDRVWILTLDAFFFQLTRLFALDLGMPAEWGIAEEFDDDELRDRAVARELARGDRGESIEILRSLRKKPASRMVTRSLHAIVESARSMYLEAEEDAWERVVPPPEPTEKELRDAIALLETMPIPTTQKGKPYSTWLKSRDGALEAVRAGNWEAFLQLTLVGRVANGETEFSKKPITDSVAGTLERLIDIAAHELIARVGRQNAAARRFLEGFEDSYEAFKVDRGAYRFDDLALALAPRETRGSGPLAAGADDLWYRLDGRIDHLLLDEFQDTSSIQWSVLRHLAEEICADGTGERSFFCVGDVKQSIYGWRQAEPRLLLGLPDQFPALEPEQLTKSYRSSSVVLDAVNRVFGAIEQNAVLVKEGGPYLEAARRFSETYGTHEAAKDLPGAVHLLEAGEAQDDEDRDRPALVLAAERAVQIRRAAPRATVGILLRRGKLIPRLIHELRERGIRASGEGGNPLTDSHAVQHVLSILRLADHPADRGAAFHVATSHLGEGLGLSPEKFSEQAGGVARSVRGRLFTEGYGAFCASFQPTVERRYAVWDQKRFGQLVELAYAFDGRAPVRPGRFVTIVKKQKVEDPSAESVKVMTIHAAKGLEFDAVVLPELGQAMIKPPDMLSDRPDPAGPIESVSCNASGVVVARSPELKRLRHVTEVRGLQESLCLLYVAMTRAVHRLDMILPPRPSRTSLAGVMGQELAPDVEADANGVLWSHPSNVDPCFAPELMEEPEAAKERSPVTAVAFALPVPRGLASRSPSAEEGGGRASAALCLHPRNTRARRRGSLIHRWFEAVEWLEDFAATDDELMELGAGIEPDESQRRETLVAFRSMLDRDAVREVLSRQDRPEDLDLALWRERSFSIVLPDDLGSEELWSGVFDRVVLHRDGGTLVGAEICDFKTDAVKGDEIEQRAAFYRPQLEGYRRVLAAMTGLGESKITAELLFAAAGRRVRL